MRGVLVVAALVGAVVASAAVAAASPLPGGDGLYHGLASDLADVLDDVDHAIPEPLRSPIWPYVGPDGGDVADRDPGGWPVLGGPYLLGGDVPGKVWPCTWDWLGWGVCGDDVHLPPVLDDSTDHLLEEQLRKATILCEGLAQRAPVGLPDCGAVARDAAEQVLPNVHYRTDFESVTVQGDPPPGDRGVPEAEVADARPADAGDVALPLLREVAAASGDGRGAPGRPLPAGGDALLLGDRDGGPATPAALRAELGPDLVGPALALVLGALALALPILVLYRRILAHRALEHPVRARMLELVRAQPGIHESRLARQMGLRHTHIQYHIRVLCQAGLLETRPFGGLKCLFELGRLSPADKAQAMAAHGRTREVLGALTMAPGVTQRVLAERLGMSESSVKWHLDRLEECGFVRSERARGVKRTWVLPAARQPLPARSLMEPPALPASAPSPVSP